MFVILDPKSNNAQKSPELATTDDVPPTTTECLDDDEKDANKIDEPKEGASNDLKTTEPSEPVEESTAENDDGAETSDTTATETATSKSQNTETETKPMDSDAKQSDANNTQDQKDDTTSKISANDENSATSDDTLIDIEDPDDYLLYLEPILIKIHTRFYALYDETKQMPDLKTLLPKIRAEVLLGKTLVFSGLVPTQIKLEKSKAYLIARSLGANVTQQLTDETTHLVASTAGTFKVNAARKMSKIHIVSPDWLWTCAERWECVEERLFPLDSKKASKTRQPPAHCHSPGNTKQKRITKMKANPWSCLMNFLFWILEHVVNYANLNEVEGPSSAEPSTSSANREAPKFIDTINPLLKFSNDDLEAMNEDVNDLIESDSSSDDEDDDLNDMDLRK